ncbi:MAG: DNA-directed RNA polymerase subunit beta' [Chloroflexi bacterium]|nr:DNA-directed RNA polymerase subunit beta' [Chloroflexota bacterium]
MLGNPFSAIRISLASPELIKSWSYGEVTKPETINYRNQKPEKDGLFDERIFGPTKDFECACGKYKRMRYRGVICDRCGVEVTRARVRRERMGHIQLATPVAHIWFAKGTPSWLGLLLDISPRNLERVVYLAQYVITSVDEEAKKELREGLLKQKNDTVSRLRTEMEEAVAAIQGQTGVAGSSTGEREATTAKEKAQLRKLEETIREQLQSLKGKKAPAKIAFASKTIVARGTVVTAKHLTALEKAASEALIAERKVSKPKRREKTATSDGEQDTASRAVAAEIARVQKEFLDEISEAEKALAEGDAELNEIVPLLCLSEARYRELHEKHAHIFTVGMGAEAFLEILQKIDLHKLREELHQEALPGSSQRAKKAAKRLRVVEAFLRSGNRPEWMVLTMLPVLPPDLRPMVQLDGGRFATSDLNDLYRRVINRNNRLRRLMDLGAPEIIVRNEKRMLQESVDALVDNGRRGRAVTGSHNHQLKSLSDMLRGKQGRFRQNLLGKRVDYSGRSVIVVGPTLKLHQCGLPKRMALELFKPFVMHRLVLYGQAHNIKSAKRMVDQVRPEVWDILEEVIKERPVLLNRAPTLHRLGIQAFEPLLVEGSAIQIHPLVCSAYNADFDGDQMAVHVPVGREAVEEARRIMLSTHNMLLPSSGEVVITPTLDIVVGCYYLTMEIIGAKGEDSSFLTFEDAQLAYELGSIDLRAQVNIRHGKEGNPIRTSVGRILFNEVLPEDLPFYNQLVDKKTLKEIVTRIYHLLGNEVTAVAVDRLKNLGFHYATLSGLTISLNDLVVPVEKAGLLQDADARVAKIDRDFQRGLISAAEREEQTVAVWQEVNRAIEQIITKSLPSYGNLYLMIGSGAKGNISQIKQMTGMRGLMADPKGRILPLPIRSSFREGLSVLEYFISTHGARKGLADTALRTADSGYLTRRLIDVSQEVIVLLHDCKTTEGIWVSYAPERTMLGSLAERIVGRLAARPVPHPKTGEILVGRDEEITERIARAIQEAEVERVCVRSPLTCEAARGLCQLCYGVSLGRGRLVERGEAVGIMAAQSIGEPGTQLTMRTFHTGGVASVDITSGLPRVEELFEARIPKLAAPIAEIDGVIELYEAPDGRHVKISSTDVVREKYALPKGFTALVKNNDWVEAGAELAHPAPKKTAGKSSVAATEGLRSVMAGHVKLEKNLIVVSREERQERDYLVPPGARLTVSPGQQATAGTPLAEGPLNPQDVLRVQGRDAVTRYLIDEVQKVYRSQGVAIHDKHIEIIVRQLLRRVRVDSPGDTGLLQGDLVDRFLLETENARVLSEGGEPATAVPVLLGVTKASLNTGSFLAAASFQETTRVLTEAALFGKVDRLLGLKENVIIGRLIPARLGIYDEEGQRLPPPVPAALSSLLGGGEAGSTNGGAAVASGDGAEEELVQTEGEEVGAAESEGNETGD